MDRSTLKNAYLNVVDVVADLRARPVTTISGSPTEPGVIRTQGASLMVYERLEVALRDALLVK